MKYNFLVKNNQRGMTLLELIVAILILGLAISVFLPFHTMVAKDLRLIQQKRQAAQLANRVMEDLVFSTTAANYNTDLAVARDLWSDNGFTVEKVISWVDDPADGLFNTAPNPDPIPFDYKSIRITVSAPDPFSGHMQTLAVLKTNLAREGAGDPCSGIIVKVNRIYDSGAPIAGALVTVSRNGDRYTGVTDEKGQVILNIDFPSGPPDDFVYEVDVAKGGWMKNPSPLHHNQVTLNRWSTKTIQMEMEIPQDIELRFNGQHLGGKASIPVWGLVGETIPEHATSFRFSRQVYPSGFYTIEVELTGWKEDFAINNGDFNRYEVYIPGPPARDNPWKWIPASGCWTAKPADLAGFIAHDPGKNRLGKAINIDFMKKVDLDWDTISPSQLIWHHDLYKNGVTSLQYMYISDGYGVSISSPDSAWTSVAAMSGTAAPEGDDQNMEYDLNDTFFMNNACTPGHGFNIRFDVSGAIGVFTIKDIALVCRYRGAKSFSAADTMIVNVTN